MTPPVHISVKNVPFSQQKHVVAKFLVTVEKVEYTVHELENEVSNGRIRSGEFRGKPSNESHVLTFPVSDNTEVVYLFQLSINYKDTTTVQFVTFNPHVKKPHLKIQDRVCQTHPECEDAFVGLF